MGHEWASRGPGGEPDEASDMLTRVVVERWFEESLAWVDRRSEETVEWAEAGICEDRLLYMTPAEFEDLSRRVGELLEPYARRVTDPTLRPADARAATYIQLGFPIEDEAAIEVEGAAD